MTIQNLKLFSPVKVGDVTLGHRVVLAPLTRYRANKQHVHGDLAVTYYTQRASFPGSLLITEATFIDPRAGGEECVPGIWNKDQIRAWKRVTDAVHEKGSFVYLQLWALGRAASPDVLKAEGDLPYVSASDVQLDEKPCPPRELSTAEVKAYVNLYAQAAHNAIHEAGFDGVEVHGANGYLIDQFTQDVSNKRTDEYGGTVENRCRFALEIVKACADRVGESKVGIRLSPWGQSNGMRMDDPKPTFAHLVSELVKRHPAMAYLHVIEPRVHGNEDREVQKGEANDFLRELWAPRPYISAGGYTRETAIEDAEHKGDMIAFGRAYIANPDLPLRLLNDLPLTKGDRDTYYKAQSPDGYIDYPFFDESK